MPGKQHRSTSGEHNSPERHQEHNGQRSRPYGISRYPQPQPLVAPHDDCGEHHPDCEKRGSRVVTEFNALFQLSMFVRVVEIRAQRMDGPHAFLFDHTQVNGALSSDFEESRMGGSVIEAIVRGLRDMVAGRAGPGLLLMSLLLAANVTHGLQHGEVR